MNYLEAIEALNAGKRVIRSSWVNKYLYLVTSYSIPHIEQQYLSPWISVRDNSLFTSWIPTQEELDAEDYSALVWDD